MKLERKVAELSPTGELTETRYFTNIDEAMLKSLSDKISSSKEMSGVLYERFGEKTNKRLIFFNPLDTPRAYDFYSKVSQGVDFVLHPDSYGLEPKLEETIRKITARVNDNMIYDFEKAGLDPSRFNTVEEKGDRKGICSDSAEWICDELEDLGNSVYWMSIAVKPNNESINHAAILVFKKEGNWVVLNAKSPRFDYTIVPKDKLESYLVLS